MSLLFDKRIPPFLKLYMLYALQQWQRAVPCIRFRGGKHPLGYVIISAHYKGCFSTSIGYDGPKIYRINLGIGCEHMGVILHEIGHMLGTWHEQARMDRDKYVLIVTQNIKKERERQFQKQSSSSTQGLEYDYSSVMHYPADAFSKNGRPTIAIKNFKAYYRQRRPVLGHQQSLSSSDKLGMKRFYGC